MPGHKKLLPRPCPQCGLENGGLRWVIFNPENSNSYRYTRGREPYIILRISHYSKEKYRSSSKRVKKSNPKEVHNFRVKPYCFRLMIDGKEVPVDNQLFDRDDCILKESITFPVDESWFQGIKKNGWNFIEIKGAHFINKGDLKKCWECENYFKIDKLLQYDKIYKVGLCVECDLKQRTKIQTILNYQKQS